jgi:membrane fusion protein (multidrug efflux system)
MADDPGTKGRSILRRRPRLVASAAAAALVAGVVAWRYFAVRESTDDAQIDGHVNGVAARVAGTVKSVQVEDNQTVEAGAVLVQIDPRDYEVTVAKAQADLDQALAEERAARKGVPVTTAATSSRLQTAESGLASAQARLVSARARWREAEARNKKAAQDLERLKPLVSKDEISRQEYDAAVLEDEAGKATLDAAQADIREAEQGVAAAEARLADARTAPEQVAIEEARAASAEAKVEQARATLAKAQLDLEYTTIKAPVAGIVSKKAVEVGVVVQPGQLLLAVVPLEDVWVTANFKENQLRRIRPGQPVAISVDAYGGRTYRGRVDSVAAATGARFSLLPAENATGNFVKVVQRVPVKIVLDAGQDPGHLLRPGLSVVPTVYTR